MFCSIFRKIKLILFLSIIISLFSCTVVKHDKQDSGKGDEVTFYFENEDFDAANYVAENWETRILPKILENAHDLDFVIRQLQSDRNQAEKSLGIRKEETSPFSFMVRGKFPIQSIDRTSSAGIMFLDIPDLSGVNYCRVQIGPIIKKSMIRDALSFIQFGDFSNQIEFANISREINFYIRDNVLNVVDDSYSAGKIVELFGVFTFDKSGGILITPVSINLEAGENDG
ncbi:MAG: DUF2291 domain-containing protein [Spirochaetales bacterium]|nr:DUF2291 domain-containing protein [Spirochaetales bacterium]